MSLDVCVCLIVVSQSGAHCHDKIPIPWALVKQKGHIHLDIFPINIFWVILSIFDTMHGELKLKLKNNIKSHVSFFFFKKNLKCPPHKHLPN